MTEMDRAFGKKLAEHLGDGPSDGHLMAQRAAILLRFHAQAQSPRRVALPWVGAGLIAGVCALGLALWLSADMTPAPSATFRGAEVRAQQSLVASEEANTLEFSDGSRVRLEPESRAQLTELSRTHTGVLLGEGTLAADVRHKPGASWVIAAGPYRVTVIGTAFSVTWIPMTQRLAVVVTRGVVQVSGGDLGGLGARLTEGQRLERSAPVDRVSAAPALEVLPVETSPAAPPRVSRPSPAMSWQQLAREGHYDRAFETAERQGLENLVTQSPAADLQLLGNAARFAGQSATARTCYRTLRDRFPGTAAAALSAYYLARLSEDADKDPKAAVGWLRLFLTESSEGDLAASARARLMDLLARQGDRRGAAVVARDYLKAHPGGSHAELARSIAGAQSAP